MNNVEQDALLQKAQNWFRQTILPKHLANTKKLTDVNEFDINRRIQVRSARNK